MPPMSSYRPLDGQPDELGGTELPDDLAAIALGNQIFKFHIPSPYRGGALAVHAEIPSYYF